MMMFRSITAAILLSICTNAQAWTFDRVKILDNYDGDTFTAQFEIWPSHFVISNVRVLGVDTPEIRGQCEQEKALAVKAKAFTAKQLTNRVSVVINKMGKYGRALGVVYIDNQRLDTMLIEAGFGRENHGEKRTSWCN